MKLTWMAFEEVKSAICSFVKCSARGNTETYLFDKASIFRIKEKWTRAQDGSTYLEASDNSRRLIFIIYEKIRGM